MPYDFAYAVKDAPSYLDFEQEAKSDGKVATGSYRVALPDGRTQKVSYKDDGYSGFVAEVQYDGEAKYPAPAPAYPKAKAYPAPEPAYPKTKASPAPAPAYPKTKASPKAKAYPA